MLLVFFIIGMVIKLGVNLENLYLLRLISSLFSSYIVLGGAIALLESSIMVFIKEKARSKLYKNLSLQSLKITESNIVGQYVEIENNTINVHPTDNQVNNTLKDINISISDVKSVSEGVCVFIENTNTLIIETSTNIITFISVDNIEDIIDNLSNKIENTFKNKNGLIKLKRMIRLLIYTLSAIILK